MDPSVWFDPDRATSGSSDWEGYRRRFLQSIAGGVTLAAGSSVPVTARTTQQRSEQGNEYLPEGPDPDRIDYVNPFWGTDLFFGGEPGLFDVFWRGNTVPGPSRPFGMAKPSPNTSPTGASSAYAYADSYIEGFSHTHLNGGGCARYGNILLAPITGPVQTTESEYRSAFSHDNEDASPGYYSVHLDDYDVDAELTATTRTGFHRYTFPESDESHILVDVTHKATDSEGGGFSPFITPRETPPEGSVTILPEENAIQGELTVVEEVCGGAAEYTIYFHAEFDTPFDGYGTWDDSTTGNGIQRGSTQESSEDCGAFIDFATADNESVQAKVGISYVSIAGARNNLETELPHWEFDQVLETAQAEWNTELGRIEVEGGTDEQKVIFYTALYHTLLHPDTFSDVDGKYLGMDDEIHVADDYTKYSVFDTWGQFRFLFPLQTMLIPKQHRDMLESYIEYFETFGWLPKWPLLNIITNTMIGDHGVPSIVGGYMKGIRDIDIETAYEGMRKSAMESAIGSDYEGREGLELYKNLGYVPLGGHTGEEVVGKGTEASQHDHSVSKTVEFAYDDWGIAAIAKKLGREDDYTLFLDRSYNYENVFDTENSGWLRPKHASGNWHRPFDPKDKIGFVEANSWMFSWFIPHSVKRLIEGMGGKDTVSSRLDHFFSDFTISPPKDEHIVQNAPEDSHYWHGNQPDQQAPYLYDYIGEPWKTQETVRWAMETQHGTGPGGISGNEDMGATSAWYVLSAMGFCQSNPASTIYELGSPIFEKVTIHLDDDYYDGETFVIEAPGASDENKYIQSAALNGRSLEKPWFSHFELLGGGELTLEMDDEPNTDWGSAPEHAPPLRPQIPNLLVAPTEFEIVPGQSRTLMARLTDDNGDPVEGEVIRWHARNGDVEPDSPTTGPNGTVVVTYEFRGPGKEGSGEFSDTITAWFPGSPRYQGNFAEVTGEASDAGGPFEVTGRRHDDATAFTGGQTDRIELTVDPSEDALVRDVIPEEWSVIDGASNGVAAVEHDSDAGVKHVYFTPDAPDDGVITYVYFVEAPNSPEQTGQYTFGPVEVQPSSRSQWVAVEGTSDTNVVVGQDTNT